MGKWWIWFPGTGKTWNFPIFNEENLDFSDILRFGWDNYEEYEKTEVSRDILWENGGKMEEIEIYGGQGEMERGKEP